MIQTAKNSVRSLFTPAVLERFDTMSAIAIFLVLGCCIAIMVLAFTATEDANLRYYVKVLSIIATSLSFAAFVGHNKPLTLVGMKNTPVAKVDIAKPQSQP